MSFFKKHLYNRKSIFRTFFKTSRRRKKSLSLRSEMQFVIALLLGVILAVGGSVFATSVGSNITVSGSIDVQSATATSTFAAGGINYGSGKFIIQQTSGSVGISSTTPAQALAVGGSVFIGASSGGGTAGGLGIGVATTTAGALELNGNVLFGGGASNLVNFNSANLNFNNIGTSTLPRNATAWGYATSTGGAGTGGAFIRFDTLNTRVGIATSTPGNTFSVQGDIQATGGLGIGAGTTTPGVFELSGNALLGGGASNLVNFNSANLNFNNIGTSTLPRNATAWGYATSTGGAGTGGAFIRFDTTNTRVGISSSTPGTTFSVQGDAQLTGGFGVGAATTTPGGVEIASTTSINGRLSLGGLTFGTTTLSIGSRGSTQGGCIELKTTSGGTVNLQATSSGFAMFAAGGC